jgi:hypothetical protein
MKPLFKITILLLFLTHISMAQETWGISNSNFAGNMGIFLNPSSIVLAPYESEFNLVSGDIFADNNYVYLKKRSHVIYKSISGESIPGNRFGDYYPDKSNKNVYGSFYLMGPSYIRNNNTTAWGLHIALRNVISVTDVPYHLAKFIYEGFDFAPQHNVNYTAGPFKAATIGWMEIGGTFAKVLKRPKNDKHIIKAGITLNFLAASDGIYIKSDFIDYTVPNSHLLVVNKMTAEYGHSAPIDGNNFLFDYFTIRGFGASASIGITYINSLHKDAYSCNRGADNLKKYNYRLGFSLIDFGYVNFNRQPTRVFNIDNRSAYWQGIDTTKFVNLFNIDKLSEKFYGDPRLSKTGESFAMYLPSALSLQFDYDIAPRYYVNFSVVKSIPLSDYSVVRSSQLALTPRYETRRSEIDVPLTFYEFSKPHLGLAVRYGILVLGTDRLGSFLGFWDSTGLDFFFGIKFTHCGKGMNARKSKTGCPV